MEWQLEREKLNGGFLDSERNITFYHETFHRGYLSTVPSFLLLFFIGRNFVFHSGWRLRTDVNFPRWLSSAFPALYDYRNHLLPLL